MQAITHPSTVWACAVIPNGDLLAGCANGNAYVWSKTAERAAPDEQVVLFKESVAAVALPAEQAEGHGLDTSNMASEEALANPGEREGQHKIIKDSASGQPTLYTWSAGERTWNKVGEIVGSKDGGGGGSTLGKRTYEGKEYDYLFDIDLDGATAKLPFNKGDDPWMAAQQFIWRHGLDQAVLDTVANHIVKNTPGNVPAATAPMNADPFTSGGAYRPGGGGAANGGGGGGQNVDPFTSGGAYRPGAGGAPQPGAHNGGYEDPLSAKRYRPGNAPGPAAAAGPPAPASGGGGAPMIAFDACKHDAVLAKLLQFAGEGLALPDADVAALRALVGALKAGGPQAAAAPFTPSLWTALLKWPDDKLFPALDLLRLVLLQPTAAAALGAFEPPLLPKLLALLGGAAAGDKALALMTLRCVANALHNPATRAAAAAKAADVLDALAPAIEPPAAAAVRLAAATVLLNVCSAMRGGALAASADADALQLQALSLCAHALTAVPPLADPAEDEALYRVLVALETVVGCGAAAHQAALDLDLAAAVGGLKLAESATQKVQQARGRIGTALAGPASKA